MEPVQGVSILVAELGRTQASGTPSAKYGDYVDAYEDYGDVYEDAYADFPEYADHIIRT